MVEKIINIPETQNVEMSEEEKCRLKGGFWDAENNICRMSQQPEQGTISREAPKTKRELLQRQEEQKAVRETEQREAEKRRIKQEKENLDKPLGFNIDLTKTQPAETQTETLQTGKKINFLNDGTVYYSVGGETFNLTKEEYDVVLGKAGMVTDKVQRIREMPSIEEQEAQVLAEQAGQIDFNQLKSQAESVEADYLKAFFKAIPNMLPDIAEAVGGGILAVASGGTLSGVGLVGMVNGIKGAYSDVMREAESQKGEYSGSQENVLEEGKQVLNDIVSARNAGASSRTDTAKAWNNQLTRIYQAYYNIQKQNIDNNFVGDDLTQEINEFEIYFSGEFLAQKDEFALALAQPDISKVEVSQEMRKRILNKIKSQQ